MITNRKTSPSRELSRQIRGANPCSFVVRAQGSFGLRIGVERVMVDSGPAYSLSNFNALLATLGMGHKYTRLFGPRQNDKVECINQTPAQER